MARKKHDPNSYGWSILRLGLGYIFTWAFLDKTFGLTVSTCSGKSVGCSQSWIHGGSPTAGFLGHATAGPFADFYRHLAGHAIVDWAFMLGLLFVGVGLLLGTWVKSAAVVGMVMLALMWSSLLWPANAPGVDEHIIYILILFGLLTTDAEQRWTLKVPGLRLP
jgi:thiosulfate dehydrogenase (quinone) large subunit